MKFNFDLNRFFNLKSGILVFLILFFSYIILTNVFHLKEGMKEGADHEDKEDSKDSEESEEDDEEDEDKKEEDEEEDKEEEDKEEDAEEVLDTISEIKNK